jgi:hypothetical protein
MRSMFASGIMNPRETAWMGQSARGPQFVYETSVSDVIIQGLKSGTDVYKGYAGLQIEKEKTDVAEANANLKAIQAQTSIAMQQTQAAIQAEQAKQNQIGGIDKSVLVIGASLLGVAMLGGIFYLVSQKKK